MIDIEFLTPFLIGGLTGFTITVGYHLTKMAEAHRQILSMKSAIDGLIKKLEAKQAYIDADEQERWELKQEKLNQDAREDD